MGLESNQNGKPRINLGDVVHMLEIAIMCSGMVLAYFKLEMAAEEETRVAHRLERVEKYLSSRDPQYWTIVDDGK